MTEDEARASADLGDRVAQRWGERPDEFHVRSIHPELGAGLAKSFGGAVVEWVPHSELVAAFTGERRECFHHGSMVRKVAQ
jgi:hypothetical protein